MFTVRLAKEDFKFSSAHFTLFGGDEAEPLHGHNYRVAVQLEGEHLDELGFLFPFHKIKQEIRSLCSELDERVLLPGDSKLLQLQDSDGVCTVGFTERSYQFPQAEVRVLPLVNITVESLAQMLWHRLATTATELPVRRMTVSVDETAGQGCSYSADLGRE